MDINFFEPIKLKKEKTSNLRALLAAVFALILLTLGVMVYLEKMNQNSVREKLRDLEASQSEQFTSQLEQVTGLEQELSESQKKLHWAQEATLYSQSLHTISQETIDEIIAQMTGTTILTDVTISDSRVSLTAQSGSLTAAAQFLYNCEMSEYFQDVSLSFIDTKYQGSDGDAWVYEYTIIMNIAHAFADQTDQEFQQTDEE